MKERFSITVSDTAGSRHYFVDSKKVRNIAVTALMVVVTVAASFFSNYFQLRNNSILSDAAENLDRELVKYDSLNSNLNQIVSNQRQQITNISNELVEIERSSGVESHDVALDLDERIQLIGLFYNAREEEYSEIGSRVDQIEDVIGLENIADNEIELFERVELASLTASQERILHDSVPSGYPTSNVVVTSKFGKRTHPLTRVKSFHKGVDIRAKTGNKIFATADGFVSISDYTDNSGKRISIMHNFGFETRYAHLSERYVKPGDIVHKGDLIALSGNTGRSAAAHLHYEIRYLGKSIDPSHFLAWEFGSNEIFTEVRGVKWPSLISLINKQITHQTLQLSLLDRTLPVR